MPSYQSPLQLTLCLGPRPVPQEGPSDEEADAGRDSRTGQHERGAGQQAEKIATRCCQWHHWDCQYFR